MVPTIEINENGDIETIYSDEIDLYSIGKVYNVRRASFVNFDEDSQIWNVTLPNGKILFSHKNREVAINEEIRLLQPGGDLYV